MNTDFSGERELVVEPMYGLRTFNLGPTPHGGVGLFPLFKLGEWFPGVNLKTCRSETFTYRCLGMLDCTCGFYAYHETCELRGDIVAIVKASGEVIVGTKGFRAEKAEVVALMTNPAKENLYPDSTRKLAKEWKLPLLSHQEFSDLYEELTGKIPTLRKDFGFHREIYHVDGSVTSEKSPFEEIGFANSSFTVNFHTTKEAFDLLSKSLGIDWTNPA